MKKLKKFTLILILACFKLTAQKVLYYEAKYRIDYNTDIPQEREGLLQIDVKNQQTIFFISKKKDSQSTTEPVVSNDGYGITYRIDYEDEKKFLQTNLKNRTIFSKETFRGNTYFVNDTLIKLKWVLDYTNQRKIGTLICNKATVNFRGRDYVAWYALDIPLGYGPYKFNGLPGLIVEINDDKSRYSWSLISYKIVNEKPNFVNLSEFVPTLTAQEYYSQVRYPSDDEQQKIIQSKLPKGVKIISVSSDINTRKGIETKFEWEEQQKQD